MPWLEVPQIFDIHIIHYLQNPRVIWHFMCVCFLYQILLISCFFIKSLFTLKTVIWYWWNVRPSPTMWYTLFKIELSCSSLGACCHFLCHFMCMRPNKENGAYSLSLLFFTKERLGANKVKREKKSDDRFEYTRAFVRKRKGRYRTMLLLPSNFNLVVDFIWRRKLLRSCCLDDYKRWPVVDIECNYEQQSCLQ